MCSSDLILNHFVDLSIGLPEVKRNNRMQVNIEKVEDSNPRLAQILTINPRYICGFRVFTALMQPPKVMSTCRLSVVMDYSSVILLIAKVCYEILLHSDCFIY